MTAPLAIDPAAERLAVGAALADPGACSDLVVMLDPADFTDATMAKIWRAVQAAAAEGAPGDLAAVQRHADGIGFAALAELVNACPSMVLGTAAASTLRRLRDRRDLVAVGSGIVQAAADPSRDAGDIAAEAVRALTAPAGTRAGTVSAADALPEVMARLERLRDHGFEADGIGTGFEALDRALRLRPGEMVVIAARPGIGKSAWLLAVALHVARQYGPVLFASLEMPAAAIVTRAVSALSRHGISEIAAGAVSGKSWREIEAARNAVALLPLRIMDDGRCRVADIAAEARRMAAREGLAAVIVDYLQLVVAVRTGRNRTRENEVGEISADLKALSLRLGVPVVVACQLNRQAEGEPPRLSQLRDSGSIEQDADAVLLLHRDRDSSEAVLAVGKNRNGPAGLAVPLRFRANLATFETLSPEI